jgi:carbonic anhydrase
MEVEVKTGGYHFIQFHAHITHEHLFKGTWTNLRIIHATKSSHITTSNTKQNLKDTVSHIDAVNIKVPLYQ